MPDDSAVLAELAEEFTAQVRAGKLPGVEDYATRAPRLAERIRQLFPTLMLLEGMAGATTPLAPTVLAPGTTFGPYRIEREIGRGGMGVVYEAVHLAMQRRVALKVLLAAGMEGGALERFLREAQTSAGLHHTNIVPVFDLGQIDGTPYYAMQLIEGRGLDRVLREWLAPPAAAPAVNTDAPTLAPGTLAAGEAMPMAPNRVRPLAERREFLNHIVEWGIQAADGLAYAHQRGVIHRDIKPSNILLDDQGIVWITDFGLARRQQDVALTQSGAMLGTPRYMSPEQAQAAKKPIDHRTDIYSLSATLYELATGRPAFDGPTPLEVVLAILDRNPVAPRRLEPAIPRDLETIIVKAMAKQADDRYQTAAELADDLRRFQRTEPIRARRIGPVGRTVRWARRNPVVAALLAAVFFSLLIGVGVASFFAKRASDRAGLLVIERDKVAAAGEASQDTLARSRFEQAAAVLASTTPGRRHKALDLLRDAERLRSRDRFGPPSPAALPRSAELRTLALQAILTPDAHVERTIPSVGEGCVSGDGRWAVTKRFNRDLSKADTFMTDLNGDDRTLAFPAETVTWAVNGDGTVVAGGGVDAITVWHLSEPTPRHRLTLPRGEPEPGADKKTSEPPFASELRLSPDGTHLAAVIEGTTTPTQLWLWDLQTNQPPERVAELVGVKVLFDPDEWFVAFSPDNRFLVYSNGGKTVTLRPLAPGVPPRTLTLPFGSKRGLAAVGPANRLAVRLHPDPKDDKAVILVWDYERNAEVARFPDGQPDFATALAFHPSGQSLAVGDRDGTVRLVELPSGKTAATLLRAHRSAISQLAWQADGARLVSAGAGDGGFHAVKAWAMDLNVAERSHAVGGTRMVFAFSPDHRWLAAATRDGKVRVWDRAAGRLAREWATPATSPGFDDVPRVALRFTPDGRHLIHFDMNDVRSWNVETGEARPATNHKSGFTALTLAAVGDGDLLGYQYRHNAIWDVRTRQKVRADPSAGDQWIGCFSADGRFVATVSHVSPATRLTVWERETGNILTEAELSGLTQPGDLLPSHLSRDGRRFVGWTLKMRDDGVRHRFLIWDATTGQRWIDVDDPDFQEAQAVSHDDRLLALALRDGWVAVWDLDANEELFRWHARKADVTQVEFSPDGRFLACADGDMPDLAMLDLADVRRRLAEIGLGW
jgi:WD40 repeat protein